MRQRFAIFVICGGALAGCATPDHSNTLIFFTNTKLALDVSVTPSNPAPDVTLGYKRQEGVWMPLPPNIGANDKRTAKDCNNEIHDCGFVGTEGDNRDTYSVLASFGATFDGSSESSAGSPGTAASSAPPARASVHGRIGLAQFFATGLAARKLAETGGARLVSIAESDQIITHKIETAIASIPSVNRDSLGEAAPIVARFLALESAGTPEAKAELEKFEVAAKKALYPRAQPDPAITYPGFRDFASDLGKSVAAVRLVKEQLAAQGVTFP